MVFHFECPLPLVACEKNPASPIVEVFTSIESRRLSDAATMGGRGIVRGRELPFVSVESRGNRSCGRRSFAMPMPPMAYRVRAGQPLQMRASDSA